MIERERGGLRVLTFEGFDRREGVRALVTTRHGGESTGPWSALNLGRRSGDDEAVVRRNRARVAAAVGAAPDALVFGRQVHGTRVAVVPAGYAGGAFDDTDALVTNAAGVPLAVLTADCAAVFLFDPVHRAVGIAHAGWRGTAARIAAEAVARMHEAFGTNPADVVAGIGPSIGPCCYEVGADVIDAFESAFRDDAEEMLLEPDMASAGSFRASVNEGRRHLDLWRANEIILESAGVPEAQIETARLCTACRTDLFYSHRAEKGRTGRFAGVVVLAGPNAE